MGEPGSASAEWQQAIVRGRGTDPAPGTPRRPPEPWQKETWVRDDLPEKPSRPSPAPKRNRRDAALPSDVVKELAAAGPSRKGSTMPKKLADAARAFDADRYNDALRLLKPLAEAAPSAAAIRELNGLTLYRLGRWRAALKELEIAHQLGGSFDQHPVMADCQRALRHFTSVQRLWDALRAASPSPEVLAEGRIVAAGALADQGDLAGAIALLEHAGVDRARPKPHHLRSWYALADLYERSGDVPRARELFRRIMKLDATFYDVVERLAAL